MFQYNIEHRQITKKIPCNSMLFMEYGTSIHSKTRDGGLLELHTGCVIAIGTLNERRRESKAWKCAGAATRWQLSRESRLNEGMKKKRQKQSRGAGKRVSRTKTLTCL